MSNVLPQETRDRIVSDIRAKYVTVAAAMLAGAGMVAILAILPAYVSIYVPKLALEESSKELKNLEAQAADDKATVVRTRALLGELGAVRPEPVSAPLIAEVLALKPASITIDNIAYRPGSPGTLTLAGKSADRQDLEAYRETLVRLGRFDSVAVPVAALVGALSGAFTITLTGTF